MTNTLERQVDSRPARRTRTGPLALGILAAAAASLLANAAIALVVTATHPGGVETGLTFAHFAPLTVLGVLIGTAGWVVAIGKFR